MSNTKLALRNHIRDLASERFPLDTFFNIFDDMYKFPLLSENSKFPLTDIYSIADEETGDIKEYGIDIAVAGFSREDLKVELIGRQLFVSGEKKLTDIESTKREYIQQSLAFRSFEKSFALGSDTHVEDIKLENGILSIKLIKEIPEEKKPKLLEIK